MGELRFFLCLARTRNPNGAQERARLTPEKYHQNQMTELYPLEINPATINGKTVLITGGTGTFGHEMTEVLLKHFSPLKVIIFSRDEYKQYLMRRFLANKGYNMDLIRFFIGDVRDYNRMEDAFRGVDIIFHAAALKQVDTIEYNPTEAIKTNIDGSNNVIRAAIRNNVSRVVALSTDKCVNPTNLYGATKLCLEKLFISSNVLSPQDTGTRFAVVRYGNVFGSRGSVAPVFHKQKLAGKNLTITHEEMTRFTITKPEVTRSHSWPR
jgi:UDP-N-acetylglucosamine 4,6-dehydratase